MLPPGLPVDAATRFKLLAAWMRDSCARVGGAVELRLYYEDGVLKMHVRAPARLSLDSARLYNHAQNIWLEWQLRNEDLLTIPETPLPEDRVASTHTLSNTDFAALMRARRGEIDRGKEAAPTDSSKRHLTVWDDDTGGACF